MGDFNFELTGLLALAMLLLLLYAFIYLPLKLITKAVAHTKNKAARVRLLHQKTVIAQYAPPANLSPAEIGFLFDNKTSQAEIFATIIGLEQRGLVKIIEENNVLVVSDVKNSVVGLSQFEAVVLENIATKKGQKISKQSLKRLGLLTGWILKQDLRDQGYLVPLKQQIKSSVHRIVFIMLLLMALFPFLAFRHKSDIGFDIFFCAFLSPFYFVVATLLYRAYVKAGGEPWLGTAKLKQIWPDIEGYREYIHLVEADELEFDSENTEGLVKNKVLPYAIALGFDTKWLNKVL